MGQNTEVEKIVEGLRLIDDALFRLVVVDPEACQEILRTLIHDEKLVVQSVKPQERMVSAHREVVLDALCVLGNGTLCNIEVQKGDRNNDIRRIRFHAAAITVNNTPKGEEFADIPDVKVLYITDYDALGNGQVLTNVKRYAYQGGEYVPLDDGEDIIFANTEVKDGTEASELLQLFLEEKELHDAKYPNLCRQFNKYKSSEGGRSDMCKSVEEYAEKCVREAEMKNAKETAARMLKNGKLSVEEIAECSGLTVEEVKALEEELFQMK